MILLRVLLGQEMKPILKVEYPNEDFSVERKSDHKQLSNLKRSKSETGTTKCVYCLRDKQNYVLRFISRVIVFVRCVAYP